jgi:uncharacterized membrane protein YbhN (UPF0104 family)
MAKLITPKVLLRGFELFLLGTLVSFGALLLYGNNLNAFLAAIPTVKWWWVIAGMGLASMDWLGGGLRNYVLARTVTTNPSLKGMILSGGMGAWASYLTPLQSGAAPMMIYTMRRYGVPVPVGFTVTLMSFIATVIFFALAGPIAIFAGAGRSLGAHGVALGISLYDLFLGSLAIFVILGVVLGAVVLFPRFVRDLLHRLARRIGSRSTRVAAKFDALERGINQAAEAVAKFNSPKGWASLGLATILSGTPGTRDSGAVRRRPSPSDVHHVLALLCPDAGCFGYCGVPLSRGHVDLRAPSLDAALHTDLATHHQLLHDRFRIVRVHQLGAARAQIDRRGS